MNRRELRRRGRHGIALVLALAPLTTLASSCGDVRSELIVGAIAGANCALDSDCRGDEPHCEPESLRCVQCVVRAHCAAGQSCTLPAGTCVQSCSQSTPCPATQPVCDLGSGLCRGCTSASECNGAPYCDAASGRCLQCIQSSDCHDFELPYCDTRSGRCVECTESGHCQEDEEQCSLVLGECAVPCPNGSGCPEDDPVCDRSIGFCVECTVDAECGAGLLCRGSDCRRPGADGSDE